MSNKRSTTKFLDARKEQIKEQMKLLLEECQDEGSMGKSSTNDFFNELTDLVNDLSSEMDCDANDDAEIEITATLNLSGQSSDELRADIENELEDRGFRNVSVSVI